MSTSILVTGSKGFIASGIEGAGLDLKTGQDINTYIAKKEYDVVVHAAALTSVVESMKNPEGHVWVNVMGTLNMLRQHPESHFIYLSTAAVYGDGLDHTVKSIPNPSSVYASTKLAGEYLVRNMAKSWCILRLTNVIGEGERGEPNIYQVFKKANVLPIHGDGLQTRDFIEVEKVREIILKCFNRTGIFNVGSGVQKTVLHVAYEFHKPWVHLPSRKGEIRNFGIKDPFDFDT